MKSGLNVDNGAKLTNHGSIVLEDYSTLTVSGTLVNDAVIELQQRPAGMPLPRVKVDGSYQGKGGFIVYDDTDAAQVAFDDLWGIDKRRMSFVHENVKPITQVNVCSIESFNFYDNFTDYDFPNMGLKSILSADKPQQFRLYGLNGFRPEEDLTIPEGAYLKLRTGSMIVPEGITLRVDGKLEISFGGTLNVAGTLENNNNVSVGDDSVLNVTGTFKNKAVKDVKKFLGDNANLEFYREEPQTAANPRLVLAQGSSFTPGLITYQYAQIDPDGTDFEAFDPRVCIQDFDINSYTRLVRFKNPSEMLFFPGERFAFGPMFSENQEYARYLSVRGRELIKPNLNQIVRTDAEVYLHGTKFEVPEGVDVKLEGRLVLCDGASLDVAGRLRKGTLELDEGTTVSLSGRMEPNKLRLDGTITAESGAFMSGPKMLALVNGRPKGSITVPEGARLSVRENGLDVSKLADWVNLSGAQSYFQLFYHAQSDADFSSMMDRMSKLPARFYGIQKLDYPAVIRGNVVFPGVEIRIDTSAGGSLAIAEGAVLTAPTVFLQGSEMTIAGTFISVPRDKPADNYNGALMLEEGAKLTVTDTGIIGGSMCTIELPKGSADPTAYKRYNSIIGDKESYSLNKIHIERDTQIC